MDLHMTDSISLHGTSPDSASAGNGAYSWDRDRQIILAQLQNVMLALRTNVKFARKSRYGLNQTPHPLPAAVQNLRDRLFQPLACETPIDEEAILKPFLDVVSSNECTEPMTGVALAAFVAFLDLKCAFVTVGGLVKMSTVAREMKSEVMDVQSHEAVLARILQVYLLCVRHKWAVDLSPSHIVSLLRSAYSISSCGSPSELLRRTAEQAMTDIVTACYTHVVLAAPTGDRNQKTLYSCFPDVLAYVCRLIASDTVVDGVSRAAVQLQGLCLAHTALFVLKDCLQRTYCKPLLSTARLDLSRALLRVGAKCDNVVVLSQMLRTMHLLVSFGSVNVMPQVLSFLTSLRFSVTGGSSPLTPQPQVNNKSMTRVPSVEELEAKSEREELLMESLLEFCSEPAFASFVFCHFDMSLHYGTVFASLCAHLSRKATESTMAPPLDAANGPSSTISQVRILALDCLLAMTSNVHKRLGRALAATNQQQLVLDEESIAARDLALAKKDRLTQFAQMFTVDEAKKAVKFLLTPPSGAEADLFGIRADSTGYDIGEFLFKHNALLDKSALGYWLGELGRSPLKPGDEDPEGQKQWEEARRDDYKKLGTERWHCAQLQAFMNCFQFRGKPLLRAIREFCFEVRLWGETQKIDRIMEEFAKQWFESNRDAPKEINPFSHQDGAFVLSFAIIMLNTDLHSSKMDKHMSVEDFTKNNRGIDNGGDVPTAYMCEVYEEVKTNQIMMLEMMQPGDEMAFISDQADEPLAPSGASNNSLTAEQVAIAKKTSPERLIKLNCVDDSLLTTFDPSLVKVMWRPCVAAFSSLLDTAASALPNLRGSGSTLEESIERLKRSHPSELNLVETVLRGFELIAHSAHLVGLSEPIDHVVVSLSKLIPLNLHDAYGSLVSFGKTALALMACRTLFHGVIPVSGASMRESWTDVAVALHRMQLCGLFANISEIQSPVTAATLRKPQQQHSRGATNSPAPPKATESGSQEETPARAKHRNISATLLSNPRVAVPPTPQGQEGGGWFSGIWGSGDTDVKRKERDQDEHNAILRARSACPSLAQVLNWTDTLPDDAASCLVSGIVASLTMSANPTPSEGFAASYGAHFLVAVVEGLLDRLHVADPVALDFLRSLLDQVVGALQALQQNAQRTATGTRHTHSADQIKEHWNQTCSRVTAALMHLVAELGKDEKLHPVMLRLLSALRSLPPTVFGPVVAPAVSTTLSAIACGGHGDEGANHKRVPFAAEDPNTWKHLLGLLQTLGRAATTKQVRQRAVFSLLTLVNDAKFPVTEVAPDLCEALACFALGDNLPKGHEDSWVNVSFFDSTPVVNSNSSGEPLMTPVRTSGATSGSFSGPTNEAQADPSNYQAHLVFAMNRVAQALLSIYPTVRQNQQNQGPSSSSASPQTPPGTPTQTPLSRWTSAWQTVLRSFAIVLVASGVTSSTSSHNTPKQLAAIGNQSLLDLQRTMFDKALEGLPPTAIYAAFEHVVFPLVESVCLPTNGTANKANRSPATQALISSTTILCQISGKGGEQIPQLRYSEETQNRTASLLTKTFMHFFAALAAEQRHFLPLWQRILTCLHTLHVQSASSESESASMLKEAVLESVRNVIFVLTAMSQQQEFHTYFALHPAFWQSTRQLLRPFDFAGPVLAHLDSLNLA